ncbi:MAG: glycosyltransferase family 9 protein [Campylobacterota bacterium]|nr:glycosyltransferase family 9 protein [Campylobacterota bacterium]
MTKILIIKLGYSETLDSEVGKIVSLGDVLRTTPILEALKEKYIDSEVVFLTDKKAEGLVSQNPFIDKLLIWDEFIGFLLLKEKYDIVINLEKHPGICALADMIEAWQKYGFRFLSHSGKIDEYNKNVSFIDYINNKSYKKDYWQKILIEHLGVKWKEQKYSLGYKPKSKEKYDIGLNYQVGSKWPTKSMTIDRWEKLHDELVSLGYRVTWQEGLDSLYDYIDWINSSKLIISQDSLGLHLAMALEKKIVGLFGATDYKEIYPYGGVRFLNNDVKCEIMPCYKPVCINDKFCMDEISIDKIINNVKELI